ncbi:MAG: TldD/PmbA family protein [Synechococcaceae bacterium WBB_32_011]|nr:TldD/PmbA family protein [Synechococcaceae bacterium WBB_32_011]
MLNPQQLHDQLSALAKQEGIQQWDMGAASGTDLSVQVDRGEPKQLKGAQRSAVTVRAWTSDGRVGITSSTDLSKEGLAQALKGAKEASAFGDLEEPPGLSCRSLEPLTPLERPVLPLRPIQSLLQTLLQAEKELLDFHPAINTVPYNGLSERNGESVYLNSLGAQRHQISSSSACYLYARAEQDGRKPRSAGAVRLAYGSEGLDVQACIKEAAELTISHLDYSAIDTGHYTCIFSPEAFLDLIGAFSNIFNARAVLDGLSLSNRDSLGKPLAVPFLNLWDDPLHSANFGASNFDGEGTPTAALTLIEAGNLAHFLHSEGTARQFGVAPTGHAGMGAKVSVGPDWFVVAPTPGAGVGDNHLNRHKADGVVWIDSLSALHAGVKASQGSFSLPFDGWLVKNGERHSIEAATVAGDIRTVLNSILALEGEPLVTPGGICPHVWVEGLSITGEA